MILIRTFSVDETVLAAAELRNLFRDYDGDIIHDIERIIRLRRASNLVKDYSAASTCECDNLQCLGADCRVNQQFSSVMEGKKWRLVYVRQRCLRSTFRRRESQIHCI
ncbi:hypothetical protein KIN20_029661 [Parelaphostrongylus tenuis]|uniref:Uncharacterized protein n=1 Tax=Parelaphostrongylus tenuis TaxID=148309 RepID=A0AAD5R306_PARTN|nr:hypothetical protein KIN20_029661 [Parelaphostrongylus tenuis]